MDHDTVFLAQTDSGDVQHVPGRLQQELLNLSTGTRMSVSFDRPVHLVEGSSVDLQFKQDGEFMSCVFRVVSAREEPDGATVEFEVLSDGPRATEQRETSRVDVWHESLLTRFGREESCIVLDISATGMALVAAAGHQSGDVVPVEMWLQDTQYLGTVTVCDTQELPRNRVRYGVRVNQDALMHNLRASLRNLWIVLQVKQLKRLAG